MTKRGLALTSETFLDVGGGSVKNGQPHALARIPLRWMIRECFRCNTGIMFDAVMLQKLGLNISFDSHGTPSLGPVPVRIPGCNPTDEERFGANTPKKGFLRTVKDIFSSGPRNLGQTKGPRRWFQAHSHSAEYVLDRNLQHHYEAEEERKDALQCSYDQLKSRPLWMILEYFPARVKKQKAIVNEINGLEGYMWMYVLLPLLLLRLNVDLVLARRWNRGRGRKVYKAEVEEGMKVHRSVKTRLEAGAIFDSELYAPQIRPSLKSKDGKRKAVRLSHERWSSDRQDLWTWVD